MTIVQLRRQQPIITEHGTLPCDVARELDFGFQRAFPYAIDLGASQSGLYLRYGVQDLANWCEIEGVRLRQLVGWLTIGQRTIGMIKMTEYRVEHDAGGEAFFEACDAESQETTDFAYAVLSAWDFYDIFGYGPLVELSRVWMHPDFAKRSLWAAAVRALIRRRYANRYAAILSNAWPQDRKSEKAVKLDWRGLDRWDHYRTALARLIGRELALKPLPSVDPENGPWWQWRPLRKGVMEPAVRPEPFDWLGDDD